MTTEPLAAPLPAVTLPITITIGDLSCQAGTITIEPGDVVGTIRREVAAFLREAADIYMQCSAEEVTDP
ncbi:hypothetical protein ABTZ57_16080 [Streptomyces sp. NPDC094048]|uniref:hypothetical protein n=1 Tax=Streptomyces sp. NPDC094048 TaxID=3155207 RepID=UPI00332ABB21